MSNNWLKIGPRANGEGLATLPVEPYGVAGALAYSRIS
jgi:hypothetical protein